METAIRIVQPILALLLSPLMFGIINRVKAFFAGRRGIPLFQVYFDLWKLFHKTVVYSRTTSWVFRVSPITGLAAIIIIALFVPLGHTKAVISFDGDFIFIIYLFALMRFFMIIAALDTGSSFEGMGASREAQFSAISEPALLLVLVALVCVTGKFSLSEILSTVTGQFWFSHLAVVLFVSAALIVVLLAENARIPVDDPNTHLELTMIHEVMVLDNSGPDFAFIILTSGLKLWIFAVLLVSVLIPDFGLGTWLNLIVCVSGVLVIAAAIGIIESCMARLRLLFVPHFIFAATVFAVLAIIFVLGK
jgi:formate hydrogenlyase subunit 4